MDFFSADLDTISITALEEFLAINEPEEQRPPEGVKLDYKLKETVDLADTVAAFANTSGGLLFVGVDSTRRKHNVPIAIPGASFGGGDVKARIMGKVVSQVTPRPDVDVGVVRVSAQNSDAVAIIRVREGTYPPYQFSLSDRVRIPVRLQDTNRQASLRDIEQLFGKRTSFAETPQERVQPLLLNHPVPCFITVGGDGKEKSEFGSGYHLWGVRPRLPLRLRLDRRFDREFTEMIATCFPDMGLGKFWPPVVTSQSHLVRWQAGIDFAAGSLKVVRQFECATTGEVRFSERIDRHTTGPESISDLFVGSLRFLKLIEGFYRAQNRFGSLSAFHIVAIDRELPITFLPTFPDANGNYHATNAIVFHRTETVQAQGRSLQVEEIENLEVGNHAGLVCSFMLAI